jgi:hypothetical protein
VEARAAGTDAYFELAFSPCLNLVSVVRRFVNEFYSQVLIDADVTSRLALATHELLENSAKYAADDLTSIRISVSKEAGSTLVAITTRNRAETEHIARLKATLDELIAAPDPQAHYLVLMRRTAKRTDGSGLGLGRVRAESEMNIAYEVDETSVTLRAEARIPETPAQ